MHGPRTGASTRLENEPADARGQIRAILGPTNTGKTHFAIDRMLGYASGMIGFPLRLLARENYDRIVAMKGTGSVALITGEEKIVPASPRWFVCTVESMPLDRRVEFLAVDEIQLCADVDRGHIFTDRLLHARGQYETLFLGSDTMRPIIRALVSGARVEERLRLSTLSYAGSANLSRLPRRSAVVAFSVDRVYELAERLRRQRGGTAVVLGALSPRTRNSQVEMYQAGEVDYMVATDAIGMGLNMDVNHVAFAGLRKFDGRRPRYLNPVEVGQIAGRAGRHMSNGSFGTTAGLEPFEPELVEALETHRFDPVKTLFWRTRELDFRSPKLLLRSLGRQPGRIELTRAREAEDQLALAALARDETVMDRATDPGAVRELWEVCQIPDFRKIMPDHHAAFLAQVYLFLTSEDGQLPEAWVRKQIDRLDTVEGDIDTLTSRIAHIRTWTYIAHRGDWLDDAAHWQGRAGAIEDRLSDALHDRLTQRFVDRRATSIGRKREEGGELLSAVTPAGEVVVEGHSVGYMAGLVLEIREGSGAEARAVMAAARRAAMRDIGLRVTRLISEPDAAFGLDEKGRLAWRGAPVARLAAGETLLSPRVQVLRSDLLDNPMREQVRSRLADWIEQHIAATFRALYRVRGAKFDGPSRGLVFQLGEHLGALPGPLSQAEWRALPKEDRDRLIRMGLRIGRAAVYFRTLQREAAMRLRRILWSVHAGRPAPDVACPGGVRAAGSLSKADWACLGHCRIAGRAIPFDRLERLEQRARRLARSGSFKASPDLLELAGTEGSTFEQMMDAIGFAVRKDTDGTVYWSKTSRKKSGARRKKRSRRSPAHPDSPFASLRELVGTK